MSKYWIVAPKQSTVHLVLEQMVEDSFVLFVAVKDCWYFREFGVPCGAVEFANQIASQDLANQIESTIFRNYFLRSI